ncbi:16S rRNA (guanine(527)-N(7))-methyltransferase RsmG [Kaistia algarum]|uniref:16S rRNA (guanine(527)-N(7))-methyltransferase RsmG n=1 Tax=Kaistia algarum TaxID=2083279 RepID=UPI002254462E|nr:16S rRNA (guanine(527)-N(7))-methyltransferase RsmG [Kaistia algarum]MCX5513866.1 16S rRNA (guanine(527)-N(7))-methyltransferase RsmG [Kaistia algarum]
MARLEIYVALLRKWQPAQNLVSPKTMDQIWRRHIADSAQLVALFPAALRWADLGSGAGLPGLVTAILLTGRDGAAVHLVESNQRKCAFLRTVVRETGAPAMVHEGRIESVLKHFVEPVDYVSARALAPLVSLLDLSEPLFASGARAAFHKGADFEGELREASKSWSLDLVRHKSMIDADSSVVEILRAERRPAG